MLGLSGRRPAVAVAEGRRPSIAGAAKKHFRLDLAIFAPAARHFIFAIFELVARHFHLDSMIFASVTRHVHFDLMVFDLSLFEVAIFGPISF